MREPTSVRGPVDVVDVGDAQLPLWVVPFDADGTCTGPETRALLVDELARGGYSEVFLFSHGWNNTFRQAVNNYTRFIRGYHDLARSNGLASPHPYKPLLVGVFWPSIDLVLPSEEPPRIAGVEDSGPMDLASMVDEAAQQLDPERAQSLWRLAGKPELTEGEARQLAEILAPAYPEDDDVDPGAARPSGNDVMQTWGDLIEAGLTEASPPAAGPDAFGVATEDQLLADPQAAGRFHSLIHFDPRDILRAFTVYKMKDRAGHVGMIGVGPLLCDLLGADDQARCHLIGHSYGCRLLLAAVCADDLPRPVRSLLLLEPAVNYLCFARQVPKVGRPGGFRPALERVEKPILTTFSSHDVALHDFFHIAVRRRSDLGELKVAALGEVPSLYAALGGWGPGGLGTDEAVEVPMARFPDRYSLEGVRNRLLALNGATGITGHSDVINDWTYWALYNQVVLSER